MSAGRKNVSPHPELGLPEVRPLWQKIDRIVYRLYELTPEEIAIVEGQH